MPPPSNLTKRCSDRDTVPHRFNQVQPTGLYREQTASTAVVGAVVEVMLMRMDMRMGTGSVDLECQEVEVDLNPLILILILILTHITITMIITISNIHIIMITMVIIWESTKLSINRIPRRRL